MTNPKNVGRVVSYDPKNKKDQEELEKLFDAAQEANPNVRYQLVVESKTCYLRKIDRETLEVALGHLMPTRGNPKPITSGELIINTCWISGDPEIKSDEDLFTTACLQAAEVIENKSSFLKKR